MRKISELYVDIKATKSVDELKALAKEYKEGQGLLQTEINIIEERISDLTRELSELRSKEPELSFHDVMRAIEFKIGHLILEEDEETVSEEEEEIEEIA